MLRSFWKAWDVEIVSALAILFAAALLCQASGCGDNIDSSGHPHTIEDRLAEWLTSQGAIHGTVYSCNSGAMCLSETGEPATEEFCYWPDAEAELEDLLGAPCHEITVEERAWPALVGCAYCCGDQCGAGANAHCGSFCEAP